MKHIFISILAIAVIGGAYIGYEVIGAKKALSPSTSEFVESSVANTPSNASSIPTESSNSKNGRNEIEEETRDFGADGQEDDIIKTTTQTSVQTNTQTSAKTYTLAEIAKHPNASSCYTAVRGTVYDLTNFITEHPGGANNILKICGKDGTSAFTKKHAGRPEPEQELAGHEIGRLAQ